MQPFVMCCVVFFFFSFFLLGRIFVKLRDASFS